MMKLLSPAQRTIAWLGILALSLGLVSCQTQCPFAPAKPTVQRIQNGVQLQAGKLNVKVQFYADDQVRVVKWVPGGTSQKASLVVIQTNLPDLNIQFQENAGTITLASAKITLQLSKSDGAIQYLTADNQNILKEQGAAIHHAGQDQERKERVQCSAEFQADAG